VGGFAGEVYVYDDARGLLAASGAGAEPGATREVQVAVARPDGAADQGQPSPLYFVQVVADADSAGAYKLRLDFGLPAVTGVTRVIPISLTDSGTGEVLGEVARPGDSDLFGLVAPLTGRVTARLTAASGAGLDSVLYAFDGQGRPIAVDDDGGEDGRDSLVRLNVAAGQRYTLLATGYQDSRGAYTLSFDYEATFATARLVPLASEGLTEAGAIAEVGQVDVVAFVAPVSGTLRLRQEAAAGSGLDSVLTVFDAAHHRLAQNDDDGDRLDSVLRLPVVAGAIYFAWSSGFASSTGAYTLALDYDETFAAALPLEPGSSGVTTASGLLAAPGGPVAYAFVAPADGLATARLEPDSEGALDPRLSAFDGEHRLIAVDDDGGGGGGVASLVQFPVVAGRTYFLWAGRVGGDDGGAGSFVLSLTLDDPPGADDFGATLKGAHLVLFDDIQDEGDRFTVQVLGGLAGRIAGPEDADVLRIVVPILPELGGATAFLTVGRAPGSLLLDLSFLDPSRSAPGRDAEFSRPTGQVTQAVEPTRTYFVRVSGRNGASGAYRLNIRVRRTTSTGQGAIPNIQLASGTSFPILPTLNDSRLPPAIGPGSTKGSPGGGGTGGGGGGGDGGGPIGGNGPGTGGGGGPIGGGGSGVGGGGSGVGGGGSGVGGGGPDVGGAGPGGGGGDVIGGGSV
ncbi:MAG TPA: hypothetical protein VF590_24465, partial [Isosphaeraceae bacterium]